MKTKETGPKFEIDIEGEHYSWDKFTITVPEIRELGGLPEDQPVLEVDHKDGSERTLDEDEVVELKPGKGFGKKVGFKRGLLTRIRQELLMLEARWPNLEYVEDGHWVRIREYPLPEGVWGLGEAEFAFQIPEQLPGKGPYGFYLRPEMRLRDGKESPANYKYPVETSFGSDWGKFSWQLHPWAPADDPAGGTNLVNFVQSCRNRLEEGR